MARRKSKNKKITLESLARMVAEGFRDTASKQNLGCLERRLDKLEQEVTKIRTTMVTKSYLDDKLADLEGSVIVRQKKENRRVNLLIELLKKKKILGKTEVNMLQEIRVFPVPPRLYK